MVSLSFFGGVNEIGGNKILLEDNGTRVFLDFGLSFRIRDKYYDEYLQARSFDTIDEYVRFGELPAIKGLYREDHLRHADPRHELLGKSGEKAADAVVITHGHMDHIGLIPYLRRDIRLMGSELTKRYIQFLEKSKDGLNREYLHWYQDFELKPGKKTKEHRSAKRRQNRDYTIIEPKRPQTVGDLEIVGYPVDHSLQGAFAYIIKTSSGNIAYTGDLRFHGLFQNESNEYLEALKANEIKVLLCEGTHIDRKTEITESALQKKVAAVVDRTKGLVLANYSHFDASRIFTLAKAASASGRRLLVNPKQAYYLSLLKGQPRVHLPSEDEVDVLMPRMRMGVWGDSRFDMEVQKNDYDWRFKDTIFERSDLLAAQDVVDAPEDYLVTCSFYELNLLHDLRPPEGSTYLWSRSMPFDEEGTLDEARVLNWLARFGIGKPVQLHCSGHMPGKDIQTLVDTAQPDILVPIHTNEPKSFRKFHDNVKLMSYGDVLRI